MEERGREYGGIFFLNAYKHLESVQKVEPCWDNKAG